MTGIVIAVFATLVFSLTAAAQRDAGSLSYGEPNPDAARIMIVPAAEDGMFYMLNVNRFS